MEPGVVLFSRFTVRKKLGAGSFGEIYEAEDTVSGQNVALKLESESEISLSGDAAAWQIA